MFRRSNSMEFIFLWRETNSKNNAIFLDSWIWKLLEILKWKLYWLTHNRSSQYYSLVNTIVKTLIRVINHKLPPPIHNCIILPTALSIIFPICSMLGSCTKCFSTSWIAQSYHNMPKCTYALHMCATLGQHPCPMYKIINSTLQCCTLCHSITSHTTLILCYHASMSTLQNSIISYALWLPHVWYYGV